MPIDESVLYAEVRERLKAQRKKQKLTQADVATRANLQRTTVANIETGHQNPPLHVFYSLCEALETEPTALLPSVMEVFETSVAQATFKADALGQIGEFLRKSPMTMGFLERHLQLDPEGAFTK